MRSTFADLLRLDVYPLCAVWLILVLSIGGRRMSFLWIVVRRSRLGAVRIVEPCLVIMGVFRVIRLWSGMIRRGVTIGRLLLSVRMLLIILWSLLAGRVWYFVRWFAPLVLTLIWR